MGTTADMGANGAFAIPLPSGVIVNVIASDGSDWHECDLPGVPWEHVSVSLPRRCPTWEEMDAVNLRTLRGLIDETMAVGPMKAETES